ncbi:hypothetical protein OQA88_3045 [Cercophora sp. LCS_1]
MAITIKIASHEATVIPPTGGANHPLEIVSSITPHEDSSIKRSMIHSSFDDTFPPALRPSPNSFVHAVIQAYNNHHHLIMRPDDVWLAIITQLSFFLHRKNTQQEERQKPVLLTRYRVGDRFCLDFSTFAHGIATAFEATPIKFLPQFRAWLTPSFSTTTDDDVVTALAVMMGTLRARFRYACWFRCGIPSVTLLGERGDYEEIKTRVELIKDGAYGAEAQEFGEMIDRVLSGFLVTFDDPEGDEAKSFLRCMIWHAGSGYEHECDGKEEEECGKRGWYNGWITAFCYWDEMGEARLRWDEAGLPETEGRTIPGGFAQVPVVLEDVEGVLDVEMMAGSVGIDEARRILNAEGVKDVSAVDLCAIRPFDCAEKRKPTILIVARWEDDHSPAVWASAVTKIKLFVDSRHPDIPVEMIAKEYQFLISQELRDNGMGADWPEIKEEATRIVQSHTGTKGHSFSIDLMRHGFSSNADENPNTVHIMVCQQSDPWKWSPVVKEVGGLLDQPKYKYADLRVLVQRRQHFIHCCGLS